MLASHIEQLLLGAIAQLALPESAGKLGESRRVAGGVGIARQNVRIGIAAENAIVHLSGGVCKLEGQDFCDIKCLTDKLKEVTKELNSGS